MSQHDAFHPDLSTSVPEAQRRSLRTRLHHVRAADLDNKTAQTEGMRRLAAISGDQSCVASTRAAYERRRDCLCDGLASIGWKMEKPEGTMFVWAPIPAGFSDSMEFVKTLFEKTGVLVTPGSAFGPSGEGHVRMALVQDEDAIALAVQRIDASGILKSEQ